MSAEVRVGTTTIHHTQQQLLLEEHQGPWTWLLAVRAIVTAVMFVNASIQTPRDSEDVFALGFGTVFLGAIAWFLRGRTVLEMDAQTGELRWRSSGWTGERTRTMSLANVYEARLQRGVDIERVGNYSVIIVVEEGEDFGINKASLSREHAEQIA